MWPSTRRLWPSSGGVCTGRDVGTPRFRFGERGGEDLPRSWRTRNMLVRDMDLDVPVTDNRRLEVVVDELPLRGGAQLAVDTTLVCALHADGTPRRGAAASDGVALKAARRRRKRPTRNWLAPTVEQSLSWWQWEERWSSETRSFLSQLARARARQEVPLLRRRAKQAWRMRWGAMLACTAAKAVASSLLDLPHSYGSDGKAPSTHEVEWSVVW